MKSQIKDRYYHLLASGTSTMSVDTFFRRYSLAVMVVLLVMLGTSFCLATTTGGTTGGSGLGVFDAGKSMFITIYKAIAGISTAAAVVAEAIAATLYFFSSNGKTVEQAQDWMKRIAIGWVIINGMGAIVATLQSLIGGFELDTTTL